jgi:alpha-beta hydrolase superfamily lysophospholipase
MRATLGSVRELLGHLRQFRSDEKYKYEQLVIFIIGHSFGGPLVYKVAMIEAAATLNGVIIPSFVDLSLLETARNREHRFALFKIIGHFQWMKTHELSVAPEATDETPPVSSTGETAKGRSIERNSRINGKLSRGRNPSW